MIRMLLRLSLFFAAALLPAAPANVLPYPFAQHDLANGLRLITIRTDYPNLVALYIVVAAGSRNEIEPGKTGFAHLFEHMMFRGTDKFPPEKYRQILQEAGTDGNAFTSSDLTAYHVAFSKADLANILMLEADRFQHLKYSADVLKTESLAVLGEYNKNSANPLRKLDEAVREIAFERHPYRHTTMGFLKDVEDMPQQYDYSLAFFDRYYRPEYTTLVVAGDIDSAAVRALVDKHWGGWQHGHYNPGIPAEPAQAGPRTGHVDWPTPTLPWISINFRVPAYTDTGKDTAALDALAFLGFSSNSALYQKLVIQEQKVDTLQAANPEQIDPALFEITARIKKEADVAYVQSQVLATIQQFGEELVPKDRLEAVKSHLRYAFSLRLDNSESIAAAVARAIPLRRTPDTINKLYALYAQLTPEDIREVARKYLVSNGRTIVTLTGKGGAR